MNVDNFIKELIINKNGIDIWYSLYYCTVTAHKVKLKLHAVEFVIKMDNHKMLQ